MQVELRAFDSLQRQILLGVFGIILVAAGLIMGNGVEPSKLATESSTPSKAPEKAPEVTDAPAVSVATPSSEPTRTRVAPADAPAAPSAASTPHTGAEALPSKVDIFWCESGDGSGDNREAGTRVGAALQSDGRVARVRVRPLSLATNARPDYSIGNDIVRFDPGERGEATILASLATGASGRAFAPAPALPGTPSVDYLSIFVCGAH
ncbi:hypothetical protein KX816_07945 [Sphingosinicellaceae bacterium]|nr:hypothetical protein KX816_07945 [Sphingosinicellaceae bacterium]